MTRRRKRNEKKKDVIKTCEGCYRQLADDVCLACIRNPVYVSKKFEPITINGALVEELTDKYVSKDVVNLLERLNLMLVRGNIRDIKVQDLPFDGEED